MVYKLAEFETAKGIGKYSWKIKERRLSIYPIEVFHFLVTRREKYFFTESKLSCFLTAIDS